MLHWEAVMVLEYVVGTDNINNQTILHLINRIAARITIGTNRYLPNILPTRSSDDFPFSSRTRSKKKTNPLRFPAAVAAGAPLAGKTDFPAVQRTPGGGGNLWLLAVRRRAARERSDRWSRRYPDFPRDFPATLLQPAAASPATGDSENSRLVAPCSRRHRKYLKAPIGLRIWPTDR